MEMKPTLSTTQRQIQSLVMTPKLQQAIKILQMPRMELSQYITQQLTENPILEEGYDELEETSDIEAKEEDESLIDIPEADIDLDTGLPETDSAIVDDLPEIDFTDDNFGDIDWKDYFEVNGTGNSEWEEPEEDDRRDNNAVFEESLQDHLLWQLRMSTNSDYDYEIGEAIIGEINDDGYLGEIKDGKYVATDINDIAESSGYSVEDIERLLKMIQTFDPIGCGSRDIEECLLIQLNHLGHQNSLAYKLIEGGYLKYLEANKYPQVAKELKVSIDEIQKAIELISSLEPLPGRQFTPVRNEYIIPDVIVEKIGDKYTITFNDYGPGLRISSYYKNILSHSDEDTKKFIQNKLESALWLLKTLESRRRTILKVVDAIFSIQHEYLEKGDEYLKPLTLREIADIVGVHESTVSRVINNKYVQTPQGTESLAHFFSSGISTQNGEMASSTSVKGMIKDLIEKEDPKNPLSDKDIGKLLSQKGFNIARRTIAKYRDEFNIPPSNKRKQW
jgi:RNA polymerase sigma-54 factor